MKPSSAKTLASSETACTSWLPPAWNGTGMPRWASQRLERVRERARQLHEARGVTGGTDLEDWLQAEQEIDGEE